MQLFLLQLKANVSNKNNFEAGTYTVTATAEKFTLEMVEDGTGYTSESEMYIVDENTIAALLLVRYTGAWPGE